MHSKHAFGMLVSLRQSCTRWRRRAVGLVAIAPIVAEASCSAGENLPIGQGDATPATDAPLLVSDAESVEATTEADASSADIAEAARIPLCLRLTDPDRPGRLLDLSADVRSGYLSLVAADCRVEGLFPTRSSTLAAWSNRLYDWNLDLWGCTDRPATGFALVHADIHDVTSADAALLIDDYLLATARSLRLSPSEATQMRQDLVALAEAAITRTSDEHPHSSCSACDGAADPDATPRDGGCASDATEDAPETEVGG
jgi:hypothetical protein